MGIDTNNSPSQLIGKVFVVGSEKFPRVAREIENERNESRGRTEAMWRAKETEGLTWHQRRSLEIERMKKRRTGEGAAS
ncbi:hypothetical protein G6024_04350 [Dietzia maris]|nr:hypothetical protein [Dietzia maris]MBB0996340.1 hypothetical protein [Dietzia maris]